MNRTFNLNELRSEINTKQSIPIVPCSPELLNKYRIKTLHKASIRPNQEISVSIREIEGLKSALTKVQRTLVFDSFVNDSSSKTPNVVSSINKSKFEHVSVLSKSFCRSKSPNERLFWLNDRNFVRNFEGLNKQKLMLREEKIGNINEKIKRRAQSKKTPKKSKENPQNAQNDKKEDKTIEKSMIEKLKFKNKFQFSPFSRRFIREASPEETIFVLPPKKQGKNFLLNI